MSSSFSLESIGNNEQSFAEAVRMQNFEHFRVAFLPRNEVQQDAKSLASRRQLESQQASLLSAAKRVDMALVMPGNAATKQQLLDAHWGRLTENGRIPEKMDPQDYLRYGDVNIMRWKCIYTEEKLENLREIAANANRPESEDRIIDAIANNTDGKGYGLELPEISNDREGFVQDLYQNRYIGFDKDVGILRPKIDQINKDLQRLRALPLNEDAAPFIAFLEDLQKVDTEMHYKNVVIPKIREITKNPRISQAAGAMRFALFLALVAMGTISLIMEGDKDFPTVAALYLGAAAFVWNPNMLSDGPTEQLAGSLRFTVPSKGGRDRWAEIMEGPQSGAFTGEKGVQLFDELLNPNVQALHTQVANEKITPEAYFTALEENGFSPEQITSLQALQQQNPDNFVYLVSNLARVHAPDAQELLLSYVEKGMTAAKANHSIATSEPTQLA